MARTSAPSTASDRSVVIALSHAAHAIRASRNCCRAADAPLFPPPPTPSCSATAAAPRHAPRRASCARRRSPLPPRRRCPPSPWAPPLPPVGGRGAWGGGGLGGGEGRARARVRAETRVWCALVRHPPRRPAACALFGPFRDRPFSRPARRATGARSLPSGPRSASNRRDSRQLKRDTVSFFLWSFALLFARACVARARTASPRNPIQLPGEGGGACLACDAERARGPFAPA